MLAALWLVSDVLGQDITGNSPAKIPSIKAPKLGGGMPWSFGKPGFGGGSVSQSDEPFPINIGLFNR